MYTVVIFSVKYFIGNKLWFLIYEYCVKEQNLHQNQHTITLITHFLIS